MTLSVWLNPSELLLIHRMHITAYEAILHTAMDWWEATLPLTFGPVPVVGRGRSCWLGSLSWQAPREQTFLL